MSRPKDTTRRDFLGSALVAAPLLAGALAAPAAAGPGRRDDPLAVRLEQAVRLRRRAAERLERRPLPRHLANGDEEELPGRIACYSKALPHDPLGVVEPRAYGFLLAALRSGKPNDFEEIPLGGQVRLANPQAALGFDLVGPDAASLTLPPAPRFAGEEQAAEMVELYWQALLRDVRFEDYPGHPLAEQAAAELSALPAYRGPRQDGRVTPRLLFRGSTEGDREGPYLSQFLLKDIPLPPMRTRQKIRTCLPEDDYLVSYDDWLAVQNGALTPVNRYDPEARFQRNGRDLAEYVHRDFSYQGPFAAGLMLLKWGVLPDGGNPYKHSRTQSGFSTFGGPYVLYLLALVTQAALSACWYQKWLVHRRLRPEEYAGRVENHLLDRASYPLPPALLDSAALARARSKWGTALLTGTYPEGCPAHPSYPAGHAVIAGACATVLKAVFDESSVVPEPVVASADGLSLSPWTGPPLTVGGELDKLAANLSLGRNFAGIHWRTDMTAGLDLGEAVAMEVLAQAKLTGNETFTGFSFRRFNGQRVTA
jgi:membrane-associated phospholipid phosphatase